MEIIIFALGTILGAVITLVLTTKLQNKDGNSENILREEVVQERNKVLELNSKVAQLETKNENYIEMLSKQEELQKRLTTEFENLASKILKENTTEFSKTNQKEIEDILKPFKERILEFEKKIETVRNDEIKDITSLKTEIKQLSEKSQKLSEEANNLTDALKGQNKTQGNWGEVILQRILEMSGLRENYEYTMQSTYKNEDGKSLRPDVIVHLPENRHVIVDSKVSLVAYEQFYNSNDESDKETFLKDFLNSLRTHIKGLSEKAYHSAEGMNSPDFVMLFIPIEASFHLAFHNDNTILDYAWDKKIVIVGPSTLLAALRTINLFWNQEKQTRNVMEIVKESGSLYDKFVGLLEDLRAASISMDKTKDCFNNAFNKLIDGKGNVIRRVENLKKLGAKATKALPAEYLIEEFEEETV